MTITKSFIVNACAAVLGVIAFILTLVTNGIAGYALVNGGLIIALAIVGILVATATAIASMKFGSEHVITGAARIVAIAIFAVVIALTLVSRSETALNLFSWDNQNATGWKAFGTAVAAIVLFLVGDIALIVTSFLSDKK